MHPSRSSSPEPESREWCGPPSPREGEPPRVPEELPSLTARRPHPWLLVEVDGSPGAQGALQWALREAARREATVLAVAVLDDTAAHSLGERPWRTGPGSGELQQLLDAQVLHGVAETGVQGRCRTAVVGSTVVQALNAAAGGADLVIVGTVGKTVLRPVVPRPAVRRLTYGA